MNMDSIYMSDFANLSVEMDKETLLSEGSNLVDTLVVYWTKNANKLQDAEKKAMIETINKSAKAIINKIGVLLNTRCSQEVIRKNVLRSLTDLNLSAEVFYEGKRQYIVKQKCINEKKSEISNEIDALKTRPVTGFNTCDEKPIFSYLIEKNSIIDSEVKSNRRIVEEKIDRLMLVWYTRVISVGIDVVALPLTLQLTGVFGAIGHTQKTVCESHPKMEETCKQISLLADDALEGAFKMIPDVFVEAYHELHDNFEKFVLSQVSYNKKLGISEEQTRQFMVDAIKTFMVGSVGGVVAVGARNAVKIITPLKNTTALSVAKNSKVLDAPVYHPALSASDAIKKELSILAKESQEAKALAYNPAHAALADVKKETNASLKSDKGTGALTLTKQEKNAMAWNQHKENIAREQSYLNALKMEAPSNLPQGFPANTKEFKLSSQILPYDRKNVGIDKKGRIRNNLRYQPIEDSKSAVFWVTRSKVTFDKVVNGQVIKQPITKRGGALDITKEALQEVIDFSKKNEYERIYILWNSKHYPVISNLPTTDKISIASVGKFTHNSNRYDTKPLDLVEILIKK